jgi:oligopeptide/dipeptide ABC transporter ATP-binding protein
MSALLSVRGLGKTFATARGPLTALKDISFEVGHGEAVAIVGESGCGKSTIALSLVRLIAPSSGEIAFDGLDAERFRHVPQGALARYVGMVFQNPFASLNPRMRIGTAIGEPLSMAAAEGRAARRARAAELLAAVGLGAEYLARFPHELSGGQRQRVAIARALAADPRLLILDEPTAALDVSVQAQVLNLLVEMRQRGRLSYLLISHNLATVQQVAQRVIVMYLGTIVEAGPVKDVFNRPRHPYTRALLEAVPRPGAARRNPVGTVRGEIPSALNRPPGCPFAPRCAFRTGLCESRAPGLDLPVDGRSVACFHPLNEVFVP